MCVWHTAVEGLSDCCVLTSLTCSAPFTPMLTSCPLMTSVLFVIGELAQVSGPEMAVYADDLFSIIIDMLQVCLVW